MATAVSMPSNTGRPKRSVEWLFGAWPQSDDMCGLPAAGYSFEPPNLHSAVMTGLVRHRRRRMVLAHAFLPCPCDCNCMHHVAREAACVPPSVSL